MTTVFYNTQHAPIGSFASFTLGAKGNKGGLGLELAKPADQNVYVGFEESPGRFACLPFFEQSSDEAARFDVEAGGGTSRSVLVPVADKTISRSLSPGLDVWNFGPVSFTIHTPVMAAPDPDVAKEPDLKLAYAPTVTVEITVDNRGGDRDRRVIFGFQSNDPYRGMRRLDETADGVAGIACGDFLALAGCSPGLASANGFNPQEILDERDAFNHSFGIGSTGLLIGVAPAGKRVTFRYAACFHRAGQATTGMDSRYFYTRFFPSLESVAEFAKQNYSALKRRGDAFDRRFHKATDLNPAQRFMLAQAIHSYYGSTELLEVGGHPLWIVNEGEYRMMNTFDLMADQVFFEASLNPWTVRNELDWYLKRYSYTDRARIPGSPIEYPGGLTFTHDMGIANHFARPGFSVYEKAGLDGCFSHMSHEELVNWVICALIYLHKTKDQKWLRKTKPVFRQVLTSLLNRDHHDPAQRDGVMSLDSSRCAGGSEITTYDSLDVSLGQARNNLYLAVKCWGCYVGLEALFKKLGETSRAATCRDQAHRAAATIGGAADRKGLLPAILGENVISRIIPAVEGLIIPHALGLKSALTERGEYGALIVALKRHLRGVLKPGVCLFPDGAWKISSTSSNTWLSKVYLCQFIAREILACVSEKAMKTADERHAAWLLTEENAYWAWSDQIVSGVAKGSKYYPRGVTAILWIK
ncbi:MAG: glycoside hydrolase family 52 protein [Terrimicrobiaceae bacterium]